MDGRGEVTEGNFRAAGIFLVEECFQENQGTSLEQKK